MGTVDVAVPELRQGSYFPDWLLEHRIRAESTLTSAVATANLKVVSTRRIDDLVKSLGITGMSESQVSMMAKDLDFMVADFRTRPLDAGSYLYLSADALTIKVREVGRVVRTAVLLATGINAEGFWEVLGMRVATASVHGVVDGVLLPI